jgi:uncharacterized membrane protein (UPF0136 family)
VDKTHRHGILTAMQHLLAATSFTTTLLWVYIVLLIAGGMIGYFKAKSRPSLIASLVFAALLALCALPGILDSRFASGVTDLLLLALMIVFGIRLAKTHKFMPSGLMLALTALVLALRHISIQFS